MTFLGWVQIILFCAIIVALVVPLGSYMTRVLNGERTFLSPVLRPVEVGLYRLAGVDKDKETRDRIQALHEKATMASLEFSRNIQEGAKTIVAPAQPASSTSRSSLRG